MYIFKKKCFHIAVCVFYGTVRLGILKLKKTIYVKKLSTAHTFSSILIHAARVYLSGHSRVSLNEIPSTY